MGLPSVRAKNACVWPGPTNQLLGFIAIIARVRMRARVGAKLSPFSRRTPGAVSGAEV